MPSAEPRSVRTGAAVIAGLAAIVAIEVLLLGARVAPPVDVDPFEIAGLEAPVDDDALFALHRRVSRLPPRDPNKMLRRLFLAEDARVREFAAAASFARLEVEATIERQIARNPRRREAFRQKLWHHYLIGIHWPPRFLSIQRIREHLGSLEGDPYANE